MDDSVEDKVLPKEKEREANKYPREALEQFQDPVQHTVQQTVVDEDPVQHTVHQTVVDEDPVFVTFQSVHVQQLVFESCEFLHGNIVAAEQAPPQQVAPKPVQTKHMEQGKPSQQVAPWNKYNYSIWSLYRLSLWRQRGPHHNKWPWNKCSISIWRQSRAPHHNMSLCSKIIWRQTMDYHNKCHNMSLFRTPRTTTKKMMRMMLLMMSLLMGNPGIKENAGMMMMMRIKVMDQKAVQRVRLRVKLKGQIIQGVQVKVMTMVLVMVPILKMRMVQVNFHHL